MHPTNKLLPLFLQSNRIVLYLLAVFHCKLPCILCHHSFRSPTSTQQVSFPLKTVQEPCLGEFGGPVSPNIVLGGFNGTAYQEATTLIITFIVNNHKDKSKLAKALAWEKAFIDFMKKYNSSQINSNLTISFSAERSIQDELDRESNTDIVTILVSYLIMFLYITVALGQFNGCERFMVRIKCLKVLQKIIIVNTEILSLKCLVF